MYMGQRDRLFGAAGAWNIKKCLNRECGLLWLDPMPIAEDIGSAYANYYTHGDRIQINSIGPLKRIGRLMRLGYWASEYNYRPGGETVLAECLGKFLYLFPIRRREADADVRCLEAIPRGRLLDVGCGSGEWLIEMRERGWEVEGVDFDEGAVTAAKQRGLPVRCGSLEEHTLPGSSFDAVTLSHVVEHLSNPIETLAECARILKPGGKLVLMTPNGASLGHRIFKQSWRGLEPPRHLHLFSMGSMRQALAMAGFETISIDPFIVTSVTYESILLWQGWSGFAEGTPRNWPAWGLTQAFKLIELCWLKWRRSAGDCMIAVAVRR